MSYDREREFFQQQAGFPYTVLKRVTPDGVIAHIGAVQDMHPKWPRLQAYRSLIVDVIKLAHEHVDPGSSVDEELYRNYLETAYHQLTKGKGDQRHGNGNGMHCYKVMRSLGPLGLGFPLGQAIKKILEASKVGGPKAVHELLGAVNYLAFAYISENDEKAA